MLNSIRLRERAFDCRQLAKRALDPGDRQMLIDIAEELDAEADRIAAESGEEARRKDA